MVTAIKFRVHRVAIFLTLSVFDFPERWVTLQTAYHGLPLCFHEWAVELRLEDYHSRSFLRVFNAPVARHVNLLPDGTCRQVAIVDEVKGMLGRMALILHVKRIIRPADHIKVSICGVDVRRVVRTKREAVCDLAGGASLIVGVDHVLKCRSCFVRVRFIIHVRITFFQLRAISARDNYHLIGRLVAVIRLPNVRRADAYGKVNSMSALCNARFILHQTLPEGQFLPVRMEHCEVPRLILLCLVNFVANVNEINRAFASSKITRPGCGLAMFNVKRLVNVRPRAICEGFSHKGVNAPWHVNLFHAGLRQAFLRGRRSVKYQLTVDLATGPYGLSTQYKDYTVKTRTKARYRSNRGTPCRPGTLRVRCGDLALLYLFFPFLGEFGSILCPGADS